MESLQYQLSTSHNILSVHLVVIIIFTRIHSTNGKFPHVAEGSHSYLWPTLTNHIIYSKIQKFNLVYLLISTSKCIFVFCMIIHKFSVYYSFIFCLSFCIKHIHVCSAFSGQSISKAGPNVLM